MPRTVHQLFRHLALLAIVLLATLPTIGRNASAGAGVAAAPGAGLARAMHPMPGMSHAMHMAMSAQDTLPMPMRAMPRHAMPAQAEITSMPAGGQSHAGHDGDCDYCPLLHGLLGALAIVLLATDADALPAPRLRDRAATLLWRYPAGLGSRGPPRAL